MVGGRLTEPAPARPDDNAREIRSYARRGTRLNPRQQQAWDSYAESWVIPNLVQTEPGFQLARAFERAAPLVIEIGCGVGEALAPLAAARPECNVVGFEVWRPGIAETLPRIAAAAASNVRLSTLDAVWCLEHLVEPESVAELWTFFPDPWPKSRHHKRRLVNRRFAALVSSRLAPGGVWRLATDWVHYAEQVQRALDDEPLLRGGVTDRYDERPLTRFERRAHAAGRAITDFTYMRPVEAAS